MNKRVQQLVIPAHTHVPAVSADDFIRSSSNQLAYDVLMQWPNWPSLIMSLIGPASSGKTHLAQLWAEKAQANIISGDILGSDASENIVGSAEALLLDNVNEQVHEEGLFHLINYCRSHHVSLLLVSIDVLSNVRWKLPDLRSRVSIVPHLTIYKPDDTLFISLLYKYFSDRQLRISMEVVEFIAKRIERSCVAALQAVERIDSYALQTKRNITVPLIRDCMGWQ